MFKLFKRHELKTIDRDKVDNEIKNFSSRGITDNTDVIVSLTSFPERMYEIKYTLYSLLNQTIKPEKVILWLSREEFPNLENDLPDDVLDFKKNGLTIGWTHNIYSYKKLIPALKEFPNKKIVTADDDIFYEKDWLEKLLIANQKYPDCIITHRAHKIKFTKNEIAPYKKWKKKIKTCKPSFVNFLTGAGGVLYPANCLYKDVTNENIFMEILPKADDIWFWAMAVLNGTKIFVPKNNIVKLTHVNPARERGLTDETTLFATNKLGGNDIQLQKLIEYYPQIINILKNEK